MFLGLPDPDLLVRDTDLEPRRISDVIWNREMTIISSVADPDP
jgi:hypothetical protein